MIPSCCICGRSPERWHCAEWEAQGGLQDFCPTHAKEVGPLEECLAPHLRPHAPDCLVRPQHSSDPLPLTKGRPERNPAPRWTPK